jgi:hypothetical protein
MCAKRCEMFGVRSAACLVLVLGMAVLADAPRAEAQLVFRFSGSAGQVGKALPPAGQPGGAPVNVHGRLFHSDAVDLCAATLTVGAVLVDADLGELVRGIDGDPVLPLVLENPQCSSSGDAIFRSPDSERPTFRIAVRKRAGPFLDFHIKVTRATIPAPPRACADGAATADLATWFVVDDGANPEVVVATVEGWRCNAPTLRAARVSAVPTPAPVPGVTTTPTPEPTATAIPTPSPVPTPEQGVEIDFTGKATRTDEIGTPVDAAEIRISGTFCGAGIADLFATSIRFDSVLGEIGGAGELLAGVPLDLAPVGPTAAGVAFRCQTSGPSCWMEVKQLDPCDLPGPPTGVRYEYLLKIDRSQDERRVPITYPSAPSCESGDDTELTTDFTITDSAPLQMRTERTWRCSGRGPAVSELRAD